MGARHLVRRATDARYDPGPGTGFRRWSVVDENTAGVHTGFGVCTLEPGGSVPGHVHSYEESFFMLDGSVVLRTDGGSHLLRAGDYGVLPVGLPHAWLGHSDRGARWADMLAPQPRERFGYDTYPVDLPGDRDVGERAVPIDVRDPRNRLFGHVDPANMDVEKQTPGLCRPEGIGRQDTDMLAVSASMRTALLVYSGITVKMMVDSDLGAELSTMFMVQYALDGVAGPHDHPFEETYLFLDGEAEAQFDGEVYRLGPGDIAFAGVGCVHGFRNVGAGTLRWLETQAPQPPGRHSYRFVRDWEYLKGRL